MFELSFLHKYFSFTVDATLIKRILLKNINAMLLGL